MLYNEIRNSYFDWLYASMVGGRFAKGISYRKLFMNLHATEFIFTIPMDENRAEDGIDMRDRFSIALGYKNIEKILIGPCSVLEMMVGLATRCEESIMDDPQIGDRTGQWFWGMIASLGLSGMTDDKFDRDEFDDIMHNFLSHNYAPNGKGGLFTIKNCDEDLRRVEIWRQLCWYLDSIYV